MSKLQEVMEKRMKELDISIYKLAQLTQITEPTLHAIKDRGDAKLSQLQKIAKVLGITVSEFDEASGKELNYQNGIGNISGNNNSQKIMEDRAQYGRVATSETNDTLMYMQKLVQAQDELLKCKDQVIGLLQKQA